MSRSTNNATAQPQRPQSTTVNVRRNNPYAASVLPNPANTPPAFFAPVTTHPTPPVASPAKKIAVNPVRYPYHPNAYPAPINCLSSE